MLHFLISFIVVSQHQHRVPGAHEESVQVSPRDGCPEYSGRAAILGETGGSTGKDPEGTGRVSGEGAIVLPTVRRPSPLGSSAPSFFRRYG